MGFSVRSWRRWLSLLLGFVLVLSLGSCDARLLRSAAARSPELVVPALGSPQTFNYALNDSFYSVFGFIYDGLLQEDYVTTELKPALAESWQISNDQKRITFTLREGLKWSDGQPFTVDDIVFTYNDIYLNKNIPTGIRDILQIGEKGALPSVRKLDERRVEFTVPEPFAPFLRYMGGIPIMPAHILRDTLRSKGGDGKLAFLSTWGLDTDPQKIVGNGPYVMESFVPSQRVIFRRNPHYWRKDTTGSAMPYIDRVVYQIIENTDSQLLRFRSGELDTLEVAPEAFPLLKRQENQGDFTIYDGGVEPGTTFIAFNLNRAQNAAGQPLVNPIKSRWFHTKEFRQAIAYAIDRETMKNQVFRGLGEIQHSFVYPGSPFYLSPQEGLKVYDYSPEKAKQLLQSAGFKYNSSNQLLDPDGTPVRFTLLSNAERKARLDMAAQIQRDLTKIGVQVDLQVLSFNSYLDKLKVSQDWECYIGGFGGGSIDPHSANNIWSVNGTSHAFNQGPTPGAPELKGWVTSDWERQIDQIYSQAVQQLDESKRKALYAQYQQIAAEQLPFIHLVQRLSQEAVRDHVQGVRFTALGGSLWNLSELKLVD